MASWSRQRAGEPDEWQPDERGRVAALDALEQRDTERFRTEPAGAIERPLACHVALDLSATQPAKHRGGRVDMREVHRATATEHRARRVEERGPAAERCELLAAARRITGLLEQLSGARGNLVGADHDRLRMGARNRASLLEREAEGPVRGRLAREMRLTHTGRERIEGQTEPCEKLASVHRGRGEDQHAHGTHGSLGAMRIALRKQ